MTKKRDFKRRVRQRQLRTGESYVTARRHVLASRPGAPADAEDTEAVTEAVTAAVTAPVPAGEAATDEPAPPPADAAREAIAADAPAMTPGAPEPAAAPPRPEGPISVVELVDVSDAARRFGLLCRVVMFPSLAERVPPARVLGRLRDLLVGTIGDPETSRLSAVALTGDKPEPRRRPVPNLEALRRLLQRARAGLGGTLEDGTLAFHVTDGDGMVPVLCALSVQDTTIELSVIDELVPERWEPLQPLVPGLGEHRPGGALEHALALVGSLPRLFVVHDGRRHVVTHDRFVIGRGEDTDLAIKDGMVSREHAAVLRRNRAYYLTDLGSAHGIFHKGMQIDHKRIDEGDVFEIAGHRIAFTFRDE